MQGTHTVSLNIDGMLYNTSTVTLAAGATQSIIFTASSNTIGTHAVEVEGLTGIFTVTTDHLAASFSVGNLTISPTTVQAGKPVVITFTVSNIGDAAGSFIAELKINAVHEDAQEVTLSAGESKTANFSVTRQDPGTYTAQIDTLSGTFTVAKQASAVIAPVIGGIIGGLLVIVLLYYLIASRRRPKAES